MTRLNMAPTESDLQAPSFKPVDPEDYFEIADTRVVANFDYKGDDPLDVAVVVPGIGHGNPSSVPILDGLAKVGVPAFGFDVGDSVKVSAMHRWAANFWSRVPLYFPAEPVMDDFGDKHAYDIDMLRVVVNIGRVTGVYHSWSTVMGQNVAIRHPEAIDNLVLVSGIPGGLVDPMPEDIAEVFSDEDRQLDRATAERFYGVDDPEALELMNRKGRRGVYRRAMGAIAVAGISKRSIRSIRQPTLIVCAKNDRITPPPNSQELSSLIPNSELVILEKGGHIPLVQDPDGMASLIANHHQINN